MLRHEILSQPFLFLGRWSEYDGDNIFREIPSPLISFSPISQSPELCCVVAQQAPFWWWCRPRKCGSPVRFGESNRRSGARSNKQKLNAGATTVPPRLPLTGRANSPCWNNLCYVSDPSDVCSWLQATSLSYHTVLSSDYSVIPNLFSSSDTLVTWEGI